MKKPEQTSRFDELFKFEEVVLSFSGGKDSSYLYQEMKKYALEHKKTFTVYHLGREAMDSLTIKHVKKTLIEADELGFRAIFDVSEHYKPIAGDESFKFWDKKREWLHDLSDIEHLLYENGMDADENGKNGLRGSNSVREKNFRKLFKSKYASVIGLRSRESLNRWRATKTQRKSNYSDLTWTTEFKSHVNFYPIFDLSEGDIWRSLEEYSGFYDKLWQFGIPVANLRTAHLAMKQSINQGDLIRQIDPEMFSKLSAFIDFKTEKKYSRVLTEKAKVSDFFRSDKNEKW